jgi:hypothetical protein
MGRLRLIEQQATAPKMAFVTQHGHSLTNFALSHPFHCGCCAGPICGARTGFAIP